LIADIQGLGWE